jgi:hypothetical protein
MRARRTFSLVVLALFMVPAAAFAASGPALSVSSYRSRANAICARERVETLSRLHAAKNLAQYLDDEVPVLRSALTALTGLNPPRPLVTLDAQVVTTVRGEVTVFTTLAGQAKAGKLTQAQWQRNPMLARLGTHELALWKQIGATTCANP